LRKTFIEATASWLLVSGEAKASPARPTCASWSRRPSTESAAAGVRSPGVRLGHDRERIGRLVLAGERRPQRQERVGFVSALTRRDGVRWKALQVEHRDVRREAKLQREDPLQLEALLIVS
jgi:hypothetical protein